jgi:hypothetical protein
MRPARTQARRQSDRIRRSFLPSTSVPSLGKRPGAHQIRVISPRWAILCLDDLSRALSADRGSAPSRRIADRAQAHIFFPRGVTTRDRNCYYTLTARRLHYGKLSLVLRSHFKDVPRLSQVPAQRPRAGHGDGYAPQLKAIASGEHDAGVGICRGRCGSGPALALPDSSRLSIRPGADQVCLLGRY